MNLIYNNKTPVGINYNNNKIETLNYNEEPVWENTPYEELEYIKSTGTQFIDTGIPAGTNTSIEVDAKLNAINNRTTMMGNWGTRENENLRWCVFFYNDNRLYFYISTSNYSWVWSSNVGNRMTYKIDHNKFYVNGNLYKDFTSKGNIDTQKNTLIFTASSDGSDACYMTLYACKVWENDVLVRDFIPVRRKSDNEICLYDKLTEEFYTNRGTGSFSAGPEKNQNINDFYKLEYIQSTGTQYIDTEFIPTSNNRVNVIFSNYTSSNNVPIFSAGTAWSDSQFILADLNGYFSYFYKSSVTNIDNVSTAKHNYSLYRGTILKDGVEYIHDDTDRNLNYTSMKLFGDNRYSKYANFSLYELLIYNKEGNNETLVKDLVPVKRKENNELGLYDLINNIFYVNNGTGEFTAGPEI